MVVAQLAMHLVQTCTEQRYVFVIISEGNKSNAAIDVGVAVGAAIFFTDSHTMEKLSFKEWYDALIYEVIGIYFVPSIHFALLMLLFDNMFVELHSV